MLGAAICTFGIHNIHQRTNITEGGVIGLMLLVEHWLKISPGLYYARAGCRLLSACIQDFRRELYQNITHIDAVCFRLL